MVDRGSMYLSIPVSLFYLEQTFFTLVCIIKNSAKIGSSYLVKQNERYWHAKR